MSDHLNVNQALPPGMEYCQQDGVMGSLEMFPSSAVAQSHVPGSATHMLQQPPTNTACHHRTSSILQNPLFDNKHIAYRKSEAKVNATAKPPQSSTAEVEEATTSTNTATSSAMMIDESVAKVEAPTAADEKGTDAKHQQQQQQPAAEAGADQNGDAGAISAVRKVR